MKKTILLLFLFLGVICIYAQQQNATFTITPAAFNETDQITITVSEIDPSIWGVDDIYLWAWYFDSATGNGFGAATNGEWTNSNEAHRFTNNGDGTYSFTMIPADFYNATGIGRIGMLAKAKDGSGDKKTQDNVVDVGVFEFSLVSPTKSITPIQSGNPLDIIANTSVSSDFTLTANGVVVDTKAGITNYSNSYIITENIDFSLQAVESGTSNSAITQFRAVVAPNVNEAPVPEGMQDGINIDPSDESITLVLYAPGKEFVHVKGNFGDNDWKIDDTYLMNKDSASDRFWITLDELSEDEDILYQYVVEGSISIADPYSTLILSEFNDIYIDDATFENLPGYPTGKTNHAVTWIQVDKDQYDWEIENFKRPAAEDLVIYELLIRDFDELHTYDAVIDRLDYLQNLGINAIELMPVSEFDGNISWGYNPSFHMALDKYYGSPEDFKKFVDECHARGIAVILDVVYNHATGQNPYYRMWNDCNGCYTGKVTSENPFFNIEDSNTSFSFFNDMDHESNATEAYVDRLNEFWLKEYNIDGYRFDFTKGFTNTVGDGGSFDQSRINILTRMNNKIKDIDPNAYVILEHFAPNEEETILINEGMMVWGNHNFNYNQATMGYDNSDFSWASYLNRGWDTPSNVSFMESHDEERLMYKNLQFGNGNSEYSVKDLSTALDRIALAGVFYFTIPGPKMIWQFGELGYDFSINTCEDGNVDEGCRTNPKPIRWDYFDDPDRKAVYDIYTKLISLRQNEPVFKTNNFTIDASSDFSKSIHLTRESTGRGIKNVTIIGNFGIEPIEIDPKFQKRGIWFNLLDSRSRPLFVRNVNAKITLQPGEFRIYGDRPYFPRITIPSRPGLAIYPNPARTSFSIKEKAQKVGIYSITGDVIKQFEGDFRSGHRFSVRDLRKGLYIVKIISNMGTVTTKLSVK
ncbi:alpha-amylase family glycosyl hydrolase [Aquimarina gracilis]|uniref:Alpha-amylase family glycosyl hydrolase n=1 Tax=Aquimarina gracilis TaxID=874422 RepID=A0ABU5ZV11_9FLAO|nr:alpha-amylase family glycosyl hydrolase [Aquimarina gracilis]MEB3345651.1 alpha-amylase family glycosyl hydrolase [Aquimarina gracilis]